MNLKFILIIGCLFALLSCGHKQEESEQSIDSAPIAISEQGWMNEQVARDISSFDFRAEVSKQLNISDTSVLNAISWGPVTDSSSGAVSLRLKLAKNAEIQRSAIEKLFAKYTGAKIADYSKSKNELAEAEEGAEYYLYLIERFGIDSVWPHTSATLLKFADKDHLSNTLKQRKELFRPIGKRSVVSRRIANNVGTDIKGSFCTVTFEYQNKDHEEITMEKIDGVYKFLGYNFIYIPRNN